MANPTTIRLPDELLKKLARRAKAHGVDRATYLRKLVSQALARDEEEDVMTACREGRMSMSEAAKRLGIDVWAFFELLRRRGETSSVSIEDWMDSASAR